VGEPGHFTRTQNRRDFSYPLPEPTLLDRLQERGVPTLTVGKLDDVFAHRGISQAFHVENNPDAQATTLRLAEETEQGLVFVNLIDFDMLYGHRRDAAGYAKCLEEADAFLGRLLPRLRPSDMLIITADHGNDPTFRGSDHTREFVPLLVYQPNAISRNLGIRQGYYDVAQSVAQRFGLPPLPRGISFIPAG
jgi:phosphopentomutase